MRKNAAYTTARLALLALFVGQISYARTRSFSNVPIADVIHAAEWDLDWVAILELGKRNDRSTIPLLEKIAHDPNNFEKTRYHAELALAMMDHGKYFERLTAGLKSKDFDSRARAIRLLGEIGNKRAIRLLIPILDDHSMPPRGKGHTLPAPAAMLAEDNLRIALPAVWDEFRRKSEGRVFNPKEAWKAWWLENRSEYESR